MSHTHASRLLWLDQIKCLLDLRGCPGSPLASARAAKARYGPSAVAVATVVSGERDKPIARQRQTRCCDAAPRPVASDACHQLRCGCSSAASKPRQFRLTECETDRWPITRHRGVFYTR